MGRHLWEKNVCAAEVFTQVFILMVPCLYSPCNWGYISAPVKGEISSIKKKLCKKKILTFFIV